MVNSYPRLIDSMIPERLVVGEACDFDTTILTDIDALREASAVGSTRVWHAARHGWDSRGKLRTKAKIS